MWHLVENQGHQQTSPKSNYTGTEDRESSKTMSNDGFEPMSRVF